MVSNILDRALFYASFVEEDFIFMTTQTTMLLPLFANILELNSIKYWDEVKRRIDEIVRCYASRSDKTLILAINKRLNDIIKTKGDNKVIKNKYMFFFLLLVLFRLFIATPELSCSFLVLI